MNNTSIGSRCFFDFSTGHTWGSPVSLTGNRVLDPTGDWAVILDNAGPYLVVDNQFRLAGAARGVRMTWADQTLVGNIYSKTNAVEERGRFRRLEEKVVAGGRDSGARSRRCRPRRRAANERSLKCPPARMAIPSSRPSTRPRNSRASGRSFTCRWATTRSRRRSSSRRAATCNSSATAPAKPAPA